MSAGLVAEFASADAIVAAVGRLRALGYARLETYTPYGIPELDAPLGVRRTVIPWLVLGAGLSGAAVALAIVYFTNAVDYPLDVGGRPINSLPADVPLMFETGVLFASATAFVLVFLFARLPRLHRPELAIPGHDRVFVDRYLVRIDATDPAYDRAALAREMSDLGAVAVHGADDGGAP